jgi:arginine repressor
MARRKIFWLHQVQPIIPKGRIPDNHRLLTKPQLAEALNRSESNIYWLMRSRKLNRIKVIKYFKKSNKWYFLIHEQYIQEYLSKGGKTV